MCTIVQAGRSLQKGYVPATVTVTVIRVGTSERSLCEYGVINRAQSIDRGSTAAVLYPGRKRQLLIHFEFSEQLLIQRDKY